MDLESVSLPWALPQRGLQVVGTKTLTSCFCLERILHVAVSAILMQPNVQKRKAMLVYSFVISSVRLRYWAAKPQLSWPNGLSYLSSFTQIQNVRSCPPQQRPCVATSFPWGWVRGGAFPKAPVFEKSSKDFAWAISEVSTCSLSTCMTKSLIHSKVIRIAPFTSMPWSLWTIEVHGIAPRVIFCCIVRKIAQIVEQILCMASLCPGVSKSNISTRSLAGKSGGHLNDKISPSLLVFVWQQNVLRFFSDKKSKQIRRVA